MVRSYSRHGPTQVFGLITSPAATSYTATSSTDSNTYAFVPAWEDVNVFDVRKGEKVGEWHVPGGREEVVKICAAPRRSPSNVGDGNEEEQDQEDEDEKIFAVAYADGAIRIWSSTFPSTTSSEGFPNQAFELVTFNGHKKSPTALTFSSSGQLLFSGGVEGEIVVWDVLGEVGLFRLKGHRGGVSGLKYLPHPDSTSTGAGVEAKKGFLLSTSKDGMMKLWDLDSRHCLETVVVGRGEVASLDVQRRIESDGFEELSESTGPKGRWTILTGSMSGEVKVWEVGYDDLRKGIRENEDGNLNRLIHSIGPLPLPNSSSNTHPIQSIYFHPNSRIPLIYVQTSDKTVQVVRIRSEEEMEARRARKRRREREKAKDKKKGGEDDEMLADEIKVEDGDATAGTWLERITDFCIVRAKAKIRSFSLIESETSGTLQILLQLNNNSLETWTVPAPPVESASGSVMKKLKALAGTNGVIEPARKYSVEHSGHRADVRTLCVSSDDQVVASASNGQLKLWNLKTGICIRTMDCGYAICSVFLPGDRHVVVGTKGGTLELFDLPSATLLQSVQAHSGPIWGIDVRPDKGGLVTGSADKDVKFWDIRTREVAGEGSKILTRLGEERVIKTKQLSLVHTKTLKMTDDVLAVKYSPDNKLLAVSLLDSTVKVFFQDSLKFFLSLYGHKLPVLSMDISQDSKLIITSSADKNIKIWGLDFGDCHKSIFAHEESIMSVGFEKGMGHDGFGSTGRGSHLFWSIGKDGLVKYWDGDKFDLIQTLRGHHSEIWSLALSHFGDFVVTGGGDRGIRVWERTEDPLFLEEEREREMEQTYESNLLSTLNREDRGVGSGAGGADGENEQDPDAGGADQAGTEADAVKKQTAESLMAGEKILEALELCEADAQTWRDYQESLAKAPAGVREGLLPPQKNPRMTALAREGDPEDGISGAEYVRRVVEGLKGPGLEDALLVLPFDRVRTLVGCLDQWIQGKVSIPLASRILFFLLRTHHHQIVSTRHLRTTLVSLRVNLRDALKHERDILGYNLAGLKYVKRLDDAERIAGVLEGEMDEKKVKARIEEGIKKRKRVGVVA